MRQGRRRSKNRGGQRGEEKEKEEGREKGREKKEGRRRGPQGRWWQGTWFLVKGQGYWAPWEKCGLRSVFWSLQFVLS